MPDPTDTKTDIADLRATVETLRQQVADITRDRNTLAGKLSDIEAKNADPIIHKHDGSNKSFMMTHPEKGDAHVGDWQEEEFKTLGYKRNSKAKIPVHDPIAAGEQLIKERAAKALASENKPVVNSKA